MDHLTATQFNEYLDETLSTAKRAQVEAHLTRCAACRSDLKSLRNLFQALASLPEETPPHDFAPAVLKGLSAPNLGLGWRLVLAVQAGLAISIILLFGRLVSSLVYPDLELHPILAPWISLFGQLSFHFPQLSWRWLDLPSFKSLLPVPITIILLAVVVLLCGLGNSRLLRNGSSVKQ